MFKDLTSKWNYTNSLRNMVKVPEGYMKSNNGQEMFHGGATGKVRGSSSVIRLHSLGPINKIDYSCQHF